MTELKIFGLRRTGTNYLSKLLKDNYKVKMMGGAVGWKHGPYRVRRFLGREVNCIVISKNIYSWLTSLHRRYSSWDFYKALEPADFTVMYSFAYGNWLDIPKKLETKKCSFVKYENLIENPSLVCERVSKELGFKRKTKEFINIERIVKPREILGTKDFDKEYYINRKYMTKYNEKLQKHIKTHTDLDVIKALGYSTDTLI